MSKLAPFLLCLLAVSASFAKPAFARDVTLRWWVSNYANVSSVRGYNVYIARADGAGPLAARAIDVGLPKRNYLGIATVVLPDIDLTSPGLEIEMTAYDANGAESPRSNRVPLPPDAEIIGAPIWSANFDAQSPGENPAGFFDSGGDFSIATFSTGTPSIVSPWPSKTGLSVAAYLGAGSRTSSPYEVEGRLLAVVGGTVSGVAVRVAAGNLGSAFLLGGDSAGVFSLQQIGKANLSCAASASTGVPLVRYRWYRFRLRYTDPDGRARLRAKVWRSGELEPSVWQADCWTDDPPPKDSGVVALYHVGAGVTYWDDLVVHPVEGTYTPIPSP